MAGGARGLILGQTPPGGGGGGRAAKTGGYEHFFKSGNLAAPGRICQPREYAYFRGCGPHLGCRRHDSDKVPKCTRTDTDTTADPLNPRNCFQALLCPEHTWRGAPRPFRDQVLFPSDLFASALTMSRRPGTHLYPKHLLSQGYPPTICSPRSTLPLTIWLVVVGADAGQTIPSGVRDGSSTVPEHECARTSSAEHSQDKKNLQPVSDFRFQIFLASQLAGW